jgi:hypothetical protein
LTTKPSKALIIGSGPIIIGQFHCHSERSEESRGGVARKAPLYPDTLHCVQGDNNIVKLRGKSSG